MKEAPASPLLLQLASTFCTLLGGVQDLADSKGHALKQTRTMIGLPRGAHMFVLHMLMTLRSRYRLLLLD